MRGLPVRRLASTALCATLALGIAGPAAAAADSGSVQDRTQAASRAPVPDADALLAQAEILSGLGSFLTPVGELVTETLQADDGRPTKEQASALADAVTQAMDGLEATAPAPPPGTSAAAPLLPAAPSVPSVPVVPSSPVAPSVPAAQVLPAPTGDDAVSDADAAGDEVAALQEAIDALLADATSGEAGGVLPAATGVVTGLLDLLTTLLPGA